jgi:Mrp family chromosome partitioning ATPase/capsular polysaccharide biosynthesis protein
MKLAGAVHEEAILRSSPCLRGSIAGMVPDREGWTQTEPDRDGALSSYVRAIRAYPLLVAAITLVAVAVCGIWLSSRAPRYIAQAQLLVTPLPNQDQLFLGVQLLRDAGDPTRTVQTAGTLIQSPSIADAAAARIGPGWTRTRVQDAVGVETVGESDVLGITAKADDPNLAARIANAYQDAALGVRRAEIRREVAAAIAGLDPQRSQLEAEKLAALRTVADGRDPTLSISSRAVPPTSQTGKPKWMLEVIALIAGFVIAASAALLADRLGRRVRDLDELRRLWPLPVLTHVPPLGRRPAGQLGAAPVAVREAFQTLRVQLDWEGDERRTILLASASAGDGKTSSALQLAAALVSSGHEVILIDADLRRPQIAERLGLEPGPGLSAVAFGSSRLADVLQSVPGLPALRVASAGPGAAQLVEPLSRLIPDLLAQATAMADFVVLDSPPLGEVGDALRIVPHVDAVLLVVRPGNTERVRFQQMRDLLLRAGHTPIGLIAVDDSAAGATGDRYGYGDDDGARRMTASRRARNLLRI